MNSHTYMIDYQWVAIGLIGVLMSLLSFLGLNLWNDVKTIKEQWITRQEFNTSNEANRARQDERHKENTGNFRRIEDKIDSALVDHSTAAVAIEKRLGDILVEVAKSRPQRQDGPERRRY